MVAQRDDFTQDSIRKLGERVALLCSNPACRAPTKGPHTDGAKAVSVGKACHIRAASLGGPRYDASQSREERRSIDNGIWLCSNCGTQIDTDVERHPANLLRTWKAKAELAALESIGKPPGTNPEALMVAMEDTLRRVLGEVARFDQLSDADARHVTERIASSPLDHRLAFPSGYIIGLNAELVSRFNRAEYTEVAASVLRPTMTIIRTTMNACSRLAFEAAREFQAARPSNADVVTVLVKTLTTSMLAQLTVIVFNGLNLQPGMAAYAKLTLDQRLEHHVAEVWDECQACLTGYDPRRHAPGSDEHARHQLALHTLGGEIDREAFERALLASVRDRTAEIEAAFTRFMAFVPKSVVVVADTVTILDSERLMRRQSETVERLTELRGSSLIPE